MWAMVTVIAVVAVSGSLLLLNSPKVSGPSNNLESASGKQAYTIEHEGVDRQFVVYRPESIELDAEVPVVFMFHGSGGTGEKMYNTTSWKAQADAEGFMVVYPTALKFHVFSDEKVVNGQVKTDVAVYQTKWNSYELPGLLDEKFPDQELHDDVAFTREIVDFVNENYATDESRFYATGFSNGGQFTARLAIETTDVFSAFAPTGAGSIPDQILAAAEAQAETKSELIFTARPVMQMIGERDPKLTHAAGVEAFSMDESAAAEGNPIQDRYISNYLTLEGLTDEYVYERTDRVSHFTFDQPVDPQSDSAYHMLIVENMGHQYPNGTNYPIDAADIFWTFFQEYSLE